MNTFSPLLIPDYETQIGWRFLNFQEEIECENRMVWV